MPTPTATLFLPYHALDDVIRRGPRASQPAASAVVPGTLYAVSDESTIIERSTGSVWEAYSPPASAAGAVFPYQFATQTTEPPSAQTLRLNAAAPYTGVTKLWATFEDSVSEDLYWGWMRIPATANLLLQDKDEHGRYVELETTGVPIDKGTYLEMPVTHVSHGTALAAQAMLVRVLIGSVAATRLAALEARVAALEGPR